MEATYRIYGFTLASDFPFKFRLEPSSGAADLRFVYQGVAEESQPAGRELPVASPMRIFRAEDYDTLVFPGIAAFQCSVAEIRGRAFSAGLEYLVEICLVGNVLAYWMELRGLSAIHASAVVMEGKAVAFLAGTSRGKTTTACSFLVAGHALLTDDIIPVETRSGGVWARPGFPQMKLLPAQLALLGGQPENYEKVHPQFEKLRVPVGDGLGAYCGKMLPLGCMYLLDRLEDQGSPSLLRVNQANALMELVRHSFVAELMDAVDRSSGRLERLAAIARVVPMRRLRLPAGYERLGEVRQLVEQDLQDGFPG